MNTGLRTLADSVDEMYLLYIGGASLKEVAGQYKTDPSYVGKLFGRAGLPRRNLDDTVPTSGEIFATFDQGASPAEIARKWGLREDQIVGVLRAAGLFSEKGESGGDDKVGPQLSDEELEQIHSVYWEGLPLQLASVPYGLTAAELGRMLEQAGMPLRRPLTRANLRRRSSNGSTLAGSQIPTEPKLPRRIQEMYELYEAGATLEEVGEEYDITRERVRQIFRATGLHIRSVAEAQALRRASELAREDEVLADYRRVGDVRAVAKQLGITQTAVTVIIREAGQGPRAHARRRTPTKKYSNQELIACLSEVSEVLGGILSVQRYKEYASGRKFPDGRPWPTNQTFQLRFGSWHDALLAAGLTPNPRSPIAGQRLFTEAHCIDALRHAARTLNGSPTASAYDALAKASQGALPSQATVRHRLGTWHEALRKARL